MNVLILDMHNICYAAQYGIAPLSVEPFGDTTAIFGGLRTLTKISKEQQTPWDYVYACFDTKESHRRNLRPEYKGNRSDTDEKSAFKTGLDLQMYYMYRIMPSMGFTCLKEAGFEADDLIAQVCLNHPNDYKLIVSNDQDLYQLLDDNTTVLKKSKEWVKVTKSDFETKYGITPKEWVQVKAIAGCTTDNVVGVPDIGEKRAIGYINGTLSAKYTKLIQEHEEQIKSNLPLVTLPFAPLAIPKVEFKFNFEKFQQVCQIFQFKSFSLLEWSQAWTIKH